MSAPTIFDAPPFVLISDNAIADHQRAVEYDGCLKRFGEAQNICNSQEYSALCRGVGLEVDGQVNEHASFLATILLACMHLDNLEVKMRHARPEDWYSPHLICRFSRIEEITTMVPPLRDKLRQLYATGYLVNLGWEPSWIYAGHTGNKRLPLDSPTIERELSEEHPFMLAKSKSNNGRATKQSKRILLMCDIGKRGLNNWPLLGVCNFVSSSSETDDIQFDFGRPCRWPPNRITWHNDPDMRQFLTTTHFMPPVLYATRKNALDQSMHQITSLKTIVQAKNLPTWESMLNGQVPKTTEAEFNPPPPLSQKEKITLANKLGEKLRETGSEPAVMNDIDAVVSILGINRDEGEQSAKWVLAKNFVTNLLKPDAGKKAVRSLLGSGLREKFSRKPIVVVRQLKPKAVNQYTLSELELFINSDPQYDDEDLDERIQRLRDDDKLTRKDIAKELQRIQKLTYHEPSKIWSLWGEENGVIKIVANDLKNQLVGARAMDRNFGGVREKVAAACKVLFDIKDASDDREMDQHAYHIAILERYRSDIQSLAISFLVSDGALPNLEALARYHGEEIDD